MIGIEYILFLHYGITRQSEKGQFSSDQVRKGRKTCCLTSTETIRLIRDVDREEGGGGGGRER